MEVETLTHVQQGMYTYVGQEFVQGQAEGSNTCGSHLCITLLSLTPLLLIWPDLKNKIARTLFLLFLQTYRTTWTDFFTGFISLLREHPTQNSSLNAQTTDLYLRVLHEISTELSDTSLRLNKPYARLNKDAEMRDAVREQDAISIAGSVFSILAESLQGLANPPLASSNDRYSVSGKVAENIIELTVRVVGDYVAWIDINLIISEPSVPLLFQCLQLPQVSVRIAATEAFIETVGKGLPIGDKLQLIQVLGLNEVLARLLEMSNAAITNTTVLDDQETIFREKLAKLLNSVGVELIKICEDSASAAEQKVQARSMAVQLFPLVLAFIADSNDDVSCALLSFTSTTLSLFKKEKKRDAAGHLTADKEQFLTQLLQAVLTKMSYGPDAEWYVGGGSEDDDEEGVAHFLDMRKNMRTLSDAIAWIAEPIYVGITKALLSGISEAIDAGGSTMASLTWQQVELALHVLYIFGEAVKCESALSQ